MTSPGSDVPWYLSGTVRFVHWNVQVRRAGRTELHRRLFMCIEPTPEAAAKILKVGLRSGGFIRVLPPLAPTVASLSHPRCARPMHPRTLPTTPTWVGHGPRSACCSLLWDESGCRRIRQRWSGLETRGTTWWTVSSTSTMGHRPRLPQSRGRPARHRAIAKRGCKFGALEQHKAI